MRQSLIVSGLIFGLVVPCATLFAQALNGGFEQTEELLKTHPYYAGMKNQNWKFDDPIIKPKYWVPNPFAPNGEFRLISDKKQAHSGDNCVFLKGDLYEEDSIPVTSDDTVTIRFWARTAEKGTVSAVFYVAGKDAEGKPALGYDAFQATEPAGQDWTKYSHTFEIPAELKKCLVTSVTPCLRSLTGAFFDDVEVAVKRKAQDDLVILKADKIAKSQAVFNGGFEDWQTLTPVPDNWDLTAGLFPDQWVTEKRPGERGSLRRMVNSGEDRKRFGDFSLLLNGRLVSGQALADVFKKDMKISFWARGEGGTLDVRVRLYNAPGAKPADVGQLGRVMLVKSDGEWKEYSGTMWVYGNSIYEARLELIGTGVVIDNLRVVLSEREAAAREVFQPILTIPLVQAGPKLATGFVAEQWKNAVEIRNGFMNMQTGNSTLRQTSCRLVADSQTLFICATCRVDSELKSLVFKRDGNVWEDDSVELYVNPSYDPAKFPARIYQFVVNANGAVYDHFVEPSIGQPPQPGWNCNGMEVKSERLGNDWIVMLAIPLREVGIVPGKNWGLNLCRTFQSPSGWTSLTGGGYQDYKRMVSCCLAADAPVIAWGYAGDLREGRLNAAAAIGNSSAQTQTWKVNLTIAGAGQERKKEQIVTVAPAAVQSVMVDAEDMVLARGRMTLQVADAQGRIFMSEAIPFDRQEAEAAGKAAAAVPAQPQLWRLEYYPVQGKINIRLLNFGSCRDIQSGKRFGQTQVVVYQGDRVIMEKIVAKPTLAGDEGHITVPFAPQEAGVYFVRATVCDDQGDCLDFVSGAIEKQPMAWLGNTLGKDHVIVPPFTPMKTRKQTISCLGRDYEIGASGLPAAITANGESALAAPVTFVMEDEQGKHSGKMSGGKLFDRTADRVAFQGKTRFTGMDATITGWAEYDGVMRCEVELLPKSELYVKSFTLEVPVTDVQYLHAVNHMRTLMNIFAMAAPGPGEYRDPHVPLWSPGHVYKSTGEPFTLYLPAGDGVIWTSRGVSTPNIYGNFIPYIWLGNARYGVSWFADNDRGWSHDEDSTCLELVRQGAVTTLRVHVIAKPVKLTGPRQFVFGLMATPVKPRITGGNNAIKVATMGFGMQFMERWSSVRFADYFLAKNLKQRWNATSGSALIYIANDLFNANDPVMPSLKDEWARSPGSADQLMGLFPMKLYGPDQADYDSRAVCAQSSRVDYQIAGLDYGMREGAVDGVYMDNSPPSPCVNIQHANCGYVREDGRVQGGCHLFETRDLIKRSATLSSQHRCHWPWWAIHMTSAMVAPCFSFADVCIDGEWGHEGKDFMDFFTLPYLEVFGAGAWGLNPGWLPKLHGLEGEIKPTRTLLAATRLYDMFIWMAHCNTSVVQKFIDLEKIFGTTANDCRFVGYWEKDAIAMDGLPVGVKSSFYVRPGKGALIYVSNFNPKPQTAACRLDFKSWNLGEFKAMDAETGKDVVLTAGTLNLEVDGHDFRLLRLEKKYP